MAYDNTRLPLQYKFVLEFLPLYAGPITYNLRNISQMYNFISYEDRSPYKNLYPHDGVRLIINKFNVFTKKYDVRRSLRKEMERIKEINVIQMNSVFPQCLSVFHHTLPCIIMREVVIYAVVYV